MHYNLRSLELPADWMLDREHIEVLDYETGQYVARPGDNDDSLYVVLEGCLAVYISVGCDTC